MATRKKGKPEEIPKTCATCRFFVLDEPKDEVGFCRRYPPVFVPSDDEDKGGWTFAIAIYDEWCGEHKPVEQ